jgi:hypothetical protein
MTIASHLASCPCGPPLRKDRLWREPCSVGIELPFGHLVRDGTGLYKEDVLLVCLPGVLRPWPAS